MKRIRLRGKDGEWFPRWIEQLRLFQRKESHEKLAIDRDRVIEFSISQKKRGRGAWVRENETHSLRTGETS